MFYIRALNRINHNNNNNGNNYLHLGKMILKFLFDVGEKPNQSVENTI